MSENPPPTPMAPIGGEFPAPPPLLPPRDPAGAEVPREVPGPPRFQPPPGYVAYSGGHGADERSASGLGKATIVLFWAVTAMSALLALALFARKSKWDDGVRGNASLSDLQNADDFVRLSAGLQTAFEIAAVILVALWARRIATNARSRGAWDVKPGLATGGWFIPIGWFWVGFTQVRKADAALGGRSQNLGRWQGAFVLVGVFGVVARAVNSSDVGASAGEVSDTFQQQGMVGIGAALVFALSALFATKAINEISAPLRHP